MKYQTNGGLCQVNFLSEVEMDHGWSQLYQKKDANPSHGFHTKLS